MERVKIIKNLIEALFAYVSEDYIDMDLERHRAWLHVLVDDVCNEAKNTIRGLSDV